MKMVMLHDYFRVMEGGGRLSLILAQQLKADLGYGFKARCHPYFDVYKLSGREFDLGIWGRVGGWRNIGLIRGFTHKTDFLKNYRVAIYSGFYAPLAVNRHPADNNIYYCHTPPRYIYDQRDYYYTRYPVLLRPIIDSLIKYHQPRFEAAVNKMDRVVTNSFNVKKRIKRFLNIDADVIYPPCETSKFHWIGQKGFYLSTARLDPLKRVNIVIEAFKKMPDQRLIVVSDGPEKKAIRKSASEHDNIIVLGNVSDDVFRNLMGNCIATIYIPKDEDFGMSPVESMAAGKPVIGVNEGGLTESIEHDETGILINSDPTARGVINAVRQLGPKKARKMMHSCRERAKMFDVNVFVSKMNDLFN